MRSFFERTTSAKCRKTVRLTGTHTMTPSSYDYSTVQYTSCGGEQITQQCVRVVRVCIMCVSGSCNLLANALSNDNIIYYHSALCYGYANYNTNGLKFSKLIKFTHAIPHSDSRTITMYVTSLYFK